MPLFSVLLPTHAHPRTLSFALDSFLRQETKDFELLVVGDGCDRESADIVNSFEDERIRFFDLPKAAGLGYANRNLALREAKGDIIAYASDDDIVLPAHLSNFLPLFKDQQCMWAYSRPLFVNVRGDILPEFINLTLNYPRQIFMNQRNMLPAGCIAHRRSCFEAVGYWSEDGASAGDWELWRRILASYGPHAIGFSRHPTMLHFNTDRRGPADALLWPRWMAYLAAVAVNSKSWPGTLRVSGRSKGKTFQEAVFDKLSNDVKYPAKLLRGVTQLMDHLAWSAANDIGLS